MAKKRKKKKKLDYKASDIHHLCWRKKDWKNGYLHLLREHWYMKVEIPRDTLHAFIHQNLLLIPLPSGRAAKKAFIKLVELERKELISPHDDIETRLSLMLSIMDFTEFKTRQAFKKQLQIVRNYKQRPP